MYTFIISIDLEVEFLSQSRNWPNRFPKRLYQVYIPPDVLENFCCSTYSATLGIFSFYFCIFWVATLGIIKWYFIMVIIFISLMAFHMFIGHVYTLKGRFLMQRNIYKSDRWAGKGKSGCYLKSGNCFCLGTAKL